MEAKEPLLPPAGETVKSKPAVAASMALRPLTAKGLLATALIMVVVEVLFGLYSFLTAKALHGTSLSPLAFAWIRDAIAAASLLIAAFIYERRSKAPADRRFLPDERDWPRFLACGFFGIWGAQGLSALALANLDAIVFSIFQPLLPLITLVIGTAAGVEPPLRAREPVSMAKVFGVAIAVGGACFVVWSSSHSKSGSSGVSGGSPVVGATFLFLQLLLGATYAVVQKPLLSSYSPLFVAAWGYTAGLGLLSLSTATTATHAADWDFSLSAFGAVAFAGFGASALAYGLMAQANALSGPLVVTAFFPLLPLTTALISWAATGEAIAPEQAGGAAGIALGLGLVLAAKRVEGRAQLAKPAPAANSTVDSEVATVTIAYD
jgi:drug/metabolite transporter (DMT)-like permease